MHRLHLLGRVDLADPQGADLGPILAQPRRLALLAYLALHGGAPVRRDRVLGLFWGELSQDRARKALNKALHFLRQALGEATILSRGADELFVDQGRLWCDAAEFRRALDDGRPSEALELYRGDLLPAFYIEEAVEFERWLDSERVVLRRLAGRAANDLARRREQDGQHTVAIGFARRAVEMLDEDERAVRQLLELLDRLGDRAGALYAYDKFARRMATEFGAEPAAETRTLMERIRARSEPAAQPVAVAAPPAPIVGYAPHSEQSLAASLQARGYTIERELGRGGMATVYLARDHKHDRRVALKVLAPEVGALRLADRFAGEIRLTAQLNHPNILPLFDSGAVDGVLYYAMPYVEGESLRARLEREKQLPIEEAIRLVTALADALEHAHRAGVVHRDIKPENILLQEGRPLLADFGIALALSSAGVERITSTGLSLGTPQYMSPEQAAGELTVGPRSDIYSLAAVAYEMLTGTPPFTGPTARAVLARVLTEAPIAPGELRPELSPHINAALLRALSKAPEDRFASARTFIEACTAPTAPTAPAHPKHRGSRRLVVPGALAAIVVWGLTASLWQKQGDEPIEFGTVRPLTTDPGLELQPAISPDGKLVAYTAGPGRESRIFVRAVAGGVPIRLAPDVTEPQTSPQWSPDGSRILFTLNVNGPIQVVPSLGGTPRTLVERGKHATWSPDGQSIAYVSSAGNFDTILVRAISGGPARVLALRVLTPHSLAWSPDGKFIAFVSGNPGWLSGSVSPSTLMVIPASGGTPIALTDGRHLHQSPAWMPDGRRLLFMSSQDGGRDIYSLALSASGRPQRRANRLTAGLSLGTFSISADGTWLAYSDVPNTANIWSVPILNGRIGSEADATPVTSGNQRVEGVAASRDGRWLAFDSDRESSNSRIYRMPLPDGDVEELTGGGLDFFPSFSPDGKQIAFHSWRDGTPDIYVATVGGSDEKLIAGGPDAEVWPSWSPDGQSVVFFRASGDTTRRNVFVVSRDSSGMWKAPRRLGVGGAFPQWSPDGRWILYRTGNALPSSPLALWIIPSEGGAPRKLVNGGIGIWSADSRTVYYRAPSEGREAIWSIPAAGGKPTVLVRFNDPAFMLAGAQFGTDGKRFYFAVREQQSGVELMEVRWRK